MRQPQVTDSPRILPPAATAAAVAAVVAAVVAIVVATYAATAAATAATAVATATSAAAAATTAATAAATAVAADTATAAAAAATAACVAGRHLLFLKPLKTLFFPVFFRPCVFVEQATRVESMPAFSTLTPYYSEEVILSLETLCSQTPDGVTTLEYLQTLFPQQWAALVERVRREMPDVSALPAAGVGQALFLFFSFLLSYDGWGKVKLTLTTLDRVFILAVRQFLLNCIRNPELSGVSFTFFFLELPCLGGLFTSPSKIT